MQGQHSRHTSHCPQRPHMWPKKETAFDSKNELPCAWRIFGVSRRKMTWAFPHRCQHLIASWLLLLLKGNETRGLNGNQREAFFPFEGALHMDKASSKFMSTKQIFRVVETPSYKELIFSAPLTPWSHFWDHLTHYNQVSCFAKTALLFQFCI